MFTTTNAIERIKEFSSKKAESTNQVGIQRSKEKTARDIAIGKLGELLVAEKYGGEVDFDIYTYGVVDSGWDLLINDKKISIKTIPIYGKYLLVESYQINENVDGYIVVKMEYDTSQPIFLEKTADTAKISRIILKEEFDSKKKFYPQGASICGGLLRSNFGYLLNKQDFYA